MWEQGDEERGGEDRPSGARSQGLLAACLDTCARALESEQDRWFLWLPVLFAGGIITYFALTDEPAARVAVAAFTTLVAGTAIAPFAVYHFHRMTHYGLIANLLAAPLVSLLI
ncbi:MAG: ComEC/Rec2 family competence protein, partial [Methyloceanibacter sp.]